MLPGFDGALLDNIVDYMTYAFAPMVLLWANGYLPGGLLGGGLAGVPLLASCYQFCRTDAKTDDHFFLGFPSYWNVVAFYVVVAGLGPTHHGVILVLRGAGLRADQVRLPVAHRELWYANMALSAIWLGLFAVIIAMMPDPPAALVVLSLGYVVYYVAVSLWLTFASPAQRAQRASLPS